MKKIALTIAFCFFNSQAVLASTYTVQCLNNQGKFSKCKVTVDDSTVSLNYAMKSQQSLNVTIPGKNIKSLSAGEYSRRRIGEAVGTAIFSFGLGALIAFSKKKRDQIGIEYVDGNKKSRATMLQIPKKFGMALKQELKAVSGRVIAEAPPAK